MIEIGMGSVQVGECDVMGHMNVRHYVSRALEALDWLGLGLGLGPAYTREHGAGLVPADQHIRFARELPTGTPFSIHSRVVHRRGETLRLLCEDAGFHAYQMCEAGVRQFAEWGDTAEGRHILIAVARYLAAHAPTERSALQTAEIARRLMRGAPLHTDAE